MITLQIAVCFVFLVSYGLSSAVCPSGFFLVNNNKCVTLFINNVIHSTAETDCRYLGGTLVNIKNAIDNRAVFNYADNSGVNSVWIGLFCFADQNTTSCFFDDQSGQASYSNFAAGFPKFNDQYGGCVYMATTGQNAGNWFNAKCDVAGMAFMCEVPISSSDNDNCPHNYNGYCYYPSTEMQLTTINTTYSRAQSICQSNNSSLVSIHSMQEIDYVKSLYRNTGTAKLTIGAQAMIPDLFQWADGSRYNFSYMDPLSKSKGNCLQMNLTSGFWEETDCQTMNYFLCKRPTSDSNKQKIEKEEEESFKFNNFDDGPDFSHCNNTLFMAPGMITSFGYPNRNEPSSYCTWRLVTQGPFKLGLYFTDLNTYNSVYVYDEFGFLLGSSRNVNLPWSLMAPTNILQVVFQASGIEGYRGFSATVIPI